MNDAELIAALGGPTKLSRSLGVVRGRVAMWASRGVIPAEHYMALWSMALEAGIAWEPPGADALREKLRTAPAKAEAA